MSALREGLESMAARVFALLCVGIVAAAALAFTASDLQRRDAERRGREQRLGDRAADLAAILQRAPADMRPMLLGGGPEAARLATPASPAEPLDARLTSRLAAQLGATADVQATEPSPQTCAPAPPVPPAPPSRPPLPELEARRPPPPRPRPPDCRRIAFTLTGGERVVLILPAGPRPPADRLTPFSPVMLGVLAAAAAALAYATARLTTSPVRRLAVAAQELGRDLDRAPLPERGPTEVRQGARAFNTMQARLKRREMERTHMLAAISHDLQTPLTRMRLRVEKVEDPALRSALLADGAAMRDLILAGLDLARAASGRGGPLERVDVDSLLDSLSEDAAVSGAAVTVAERCGAVARTRPEALKRCVANVLENAVKYAGSAELACSLRDDVVVIEVRDRGPGVPEDRLEAVLQPFVRLETSRSRDTGGVGLGLTIARLMADLADAELTLANRRGGGLRVTIRLQSG